MRGLGNVVGMTAPNLYNYYSSKDEIYLSIIIRGFEMLYNQMETEYKAEGEAIVRARRIIRTYLDFGLQNSKYYELMFSRPIPDHKEYLGTPYEILAEHEHHISMEIARLTMRIGREVLPPGEETEKSLPSRVIYIWSLLHGMITLFNSRIVSYIHENPEPLYERFIDEIMDILQNESSRLHTTL